MFKHVLVVCTGNICRSPVAEAMLKHRLPHLHIESAGLGALVGQGVDEKAKKLAEVDGYYVEHHKARQLTREMLQDADIVLVMSKGQRQAIGNLDSTAMGKTMLLGRWLNSSGDESIPDPYRKSNEAFEYVHSLLLKATNAWADKL